MPGSINFDKNNNKKSMADMSWKATAIGLGLGVVSVGGTIGVVARGLAKAHGLKGAALITSTLSKIGGGALKHGGGGVAGGVIRLCIIGGSAVMIGAASSVLQDVAKAKKDQDVI